MAARTRKSKESVQLTDSLTEQEQKAVEPLIEAFLENSNPLSEYGLESVEKAATKIHLVDREKGDVGKSLFTRVLIQYFLDKKFPFIAVDADRSNPDVSRIYESVCREALFSEMRRSFMKLTEFLSGLLKRV